MIMCLRNLPSTTECKPGAFELEQWLWFTSDAVVLYIAVNIGRHLGAGELL